MQMESHIQELLFKHSCIVVPGFGAFMAHTAPAAHDTGANQLHPPKKTLSFHPRLNHDDGLLVQHLLKGQVSNSAEAKEQIQATAEEWKSTLESGNPLHLEGLGSLKKSALERIEFEAEVHSNYLPSSFGLSAIEVLPKDQAKAMPVQESSERSFQLTTAEEIEEDEAGILPWLKYASMILLLISVTLTAFYFYNQDQKKNRLAQQEANDAIANYVQQETFYESSLIELPPVEVKVEKFHVMAGAFRIQENATRKMAELRAKGFDSQYLGKNQYNLHQVSYGGFENPKDAKKFLSLIQESENADAWILAKNQ